MLTDSIDPDNADERYERAIERCIGYITLQPENCMSSIREPTRSIGEVRTLVTPKARLNTLTYVEEQGGWRVPDPVAFPRRAKHRSAASARVQLPRRCDRHAASVGCAAGSHRGARHDTG